MRPHYYLVLIATLLWCAALCAQNSMRELTLTLGRGEVIAFNGDVRTVAASEPKIADVIVVSPREVMINAKGVGKSTVVVWEQTGAPKRYDVNVISDSTDFDAIRSAVNDAVKQGSVSITGNAETVVLTGESKSLDESRRAEAIAATHSKKVINLIKTPEPAEPRQILLEVKFASIDRAALSEFGINLFSRNGKMLGAGTTQQFAGPRFSQLQFQDQEFSNSTLNFSDLLNLFIFRPDLNIGATVRAMQSRNLLQILAEPNLIALEGKEASFLAGGEFPFPTLTATSTGGATAPVVTVQFKKFGVQLDFMPTITTSGGIHLKVKPSVSSLDFANAVTLQGVLIPAIATRYAETETILKDGESFAIAGLIDSRVIQSLNRVKWLGDVPILGQLFRSRSTRKTTDELMVVVTPHLVKPLTPDQKAQLPDMVETFLPPTKMDKDAGLPRPDGRKGLFRRKKKDAGNNDSQKPEFIGPRGHQEPK